VFCENDKGLIGLFVVPNIELPIIDEGGGPEGVKDREEEGGGPAGVVEGLFDAPKENMFLPLLKLLLGVDGGLDD